ncbi:uncharacterized protein LOC126734690 [Anthonomus grandis grandis]|uniref:uncharacterized protein LOC126734690 n=1 Tax=Anthonomus grandis grandis TaxID=2921223 RepID=UPI0021658FD7|nr:uncharacterized protein LOC126734690 [Anthonomus grandis grandis]XP_050294357.1 uncharacterized protein LOC126734690 [Anthonomus grandis grandis]
MDLGVALWKASLIMALIALPKLVDGNADIIRITRNIDGDIFVVNQDKSKPCQEDTCIVLSQGTAKSLAKENLCMCKCHPQRPAFREDLNTCVEEIQECPLAPFVGALLPLQETIPLIFLPQKGQIIHPSKEIFFNGIRKPICAVSGAKFLTEDGWTDLRNPVDTDIPFRLYRDEGRTFLEWIGEKELHQKISGRLVLVQLMCRELEADLTIDSSQTFFSPCVSFRIVGSPIILQTNITEVLFSLEAHSATESSEEGLSVTEYVAIAICSVLLGLIYVASIFLYLHLKKKNSAKDSVKGRDSDSIIAVEEGIVKNNPLLGLSHHFNPSENTAYSDSNNSDTDNAPDVIPNLETQITSAIIHTQQRNRYCKSSSSSCHSSDGFQDNSSFECLPEENVSIVETLDDRTDHLKGLTGTVRKKLYFNPAYFEPHLLLAPPPAALEFLAKIREVITIAKQKMATKKYVPSLLNIPEEEPGSYLIGPTLDFSRPSSRRGSVISLKRENSRRKLCSGCPGCEPQDFGLIRDVPTLGACQNCSSSNESKQNSIQKWLEDIPILRLDENSGPSSSLRSPRRIRSPTKSLPPESVSSERALSLRAVSEKALKPHKSAVHQGKKKIVAKSTAGTMKSKEKKIFKPKSPPPPTPKQVNEDNYYDCVPAEGRTNLPPPDMIQEAIEMESQETTRIPTLTKKQMNAVINELTIHKNMLEAANRELAKRANAGYETDSLERNNKSKGCSTPSDYTEVPSSQASPSLSTALPVDEEITMQNAILNPEVLNNHEQHDYELVVLRNNGDIHKLPELFHGKHGSGYSLVSEVYVNNGYGSNPSSPSESNCSTLEKRTLKVRYDGVQPGKLLIEVEDCLDHYIPVNDSDEFDPDTLDRPNKYEKMTVPSNNGHLDHCNQILLRSSGSFKSSCDNFDINANNIEISNFNRVFGSLREMYEEKRKLAREREQFSLESMETDDEGKLLTLEERHSKRQRIKTTSQGAAVPPDLIPPPPLDGVIYERPKPPRKVTPDKLQMYSKNSQGRSADTTTLNSASTPDNQLDSKEYKLCLLQKSKSNGLVTDLIQTEDLILKKNDNDQFVFHSSISNMPYPIPIKSFLKNEKNSPKVFFKNKKNNWQNTFLRPEDSGYLSTDSNESKLKKLYSEQNSETDNESVGDAQSESGAESVETHSVFFGRFHRKPQSFYTTSLDSGVLNCAEENSSSDSETVSYTTVVPVNSNHSSLVLR